MKSYYCPDCGAEIPVEDINVKADVMLCKACGTASSFSEAVSSSEESDVDAKCLSQKPPKQLKVERCMNPDDGSEVLSMTYKRISPSVIFLVVFTLLWGGGSMSVIFGTQIAKREFDPGVSLFGIPFLFGTVVLVGIILFNLFGKRCLTLVRGKGTWFSGVGCIGRTKRFSLTRETKIEKGCTSYQVNGRSLPQIEMSTPGEKKIMIAAGLKEDSLDYVAAQLRREVQRI